MDRIQLISRREHIRNAFRENKLTSLQLQVSNSIQEGFRAARKNGATLIFLDAELIEPAHEDYIRKIEIEYKEEKFPAVCVGLYDQANQLPRFLKPNEFFFQDASFLPEDLFASKQQAQWLSELIRRNLKIIKLKQSNRFLRNRHNMLMSALPSKSASHLDVDEYEHAVPSIWAGKSPAIVVFRELFKMAANSTKPVFMSGSKGHEFIEIGRELHQKSKNAEKPYYYFNLARIPKSQHQQFLYGHRETAEDGSTAYYPGFFEKEEGCTFHLHNIEYLSWEDQAILHESLKNRKYTRPGGRKLIPLNSRFIFSSEKNLEDMIDKNVFRQDLFSYISSFSMEIPNLNDRKKDIPEIVANWSRWYNQKNKSSVRFQHELLKHISEKKWSAGVRELYAYLNDLAEMARSQKDSVEYQSLSIRAVENFRREDGKSTEPNLFSEITFSGKYEPSLTEVEKQYIRQVLQNHPYNISEAARILGISRKTLYAKIEKYELTGLLAERNNGARKA